MCAVRYRGKAPAKDFLEGLERSSQNKFKAVIDELLTNGWITNRERFHKLHASGKPDVYEMKVHDGGGMRLFCILHGSDWYATHGVISKPNRQLAEEIRKARRIYKGRGAQ